jgi:hypothetical protein
MKILAVPSARDWFKSLLIIPFGALWSMVGGGLTEVLNRLNEQMPVPVLLLVMGGLFSMVIFPILSTAFIHHWLWGKEGSRFLGWLPKKESWGEALWIWWAALSGILLFFVVISIIALFYVGFAYSLGKLAGVSEAELGLRTARIVLDAMDAQEFSHETTFFGIALWVYCAARVFRCQRLRKVKAPTEGA